MLLERLQKRCRSARLRGIASVADSALTFSKRSRHGCGMATIEYASGEQLYGVVFDLDESERPKLDKAEGLGNGYDRNDTFVVQMHGSNEALQAFTYIANSTHMDSALRPYEWYHTLVLAGARQHRLPAAYLAQIRATECIEDPYAERPERLAALALLGGLSN